MKFIMTIVFAFSALSAFAQNNSFETICYNKSLVQYQDNVTECKSGLKVNVKVSKYKGRSGINTYGVQNQGQDYYVLNHVTSSMWFEWMEDEIKCGGGNSSRPQIQYIHNEQLSLTFFDLEQIDSFISDRYCQRSQTSGLVQL